MLYVAVVGQGAETLAGRMGRNLEKMRVVYPANPSASLQTALLNCMFSLEKEINSKFFQMVMIVIDPPRKDSPDFDPIRNYLKVDERRYWIPFWLNETPPETEANEPHLTTTSTYGDAVKIISQVTEQPFKVDEEYENSPILTRAMVRQQYDPTRQKPGVNRYGKSKDEKQKLGLGRAAVISLTAVKGGTGKSTLSLIAHRLMTEYALEHGRKALLIEADIGQPTILEAVWAKSTDGKDLTWALTQIEEGADPVDAMRKSVSNLVPKTDDSPTVQGIVTTLRGDKEMSANFPPHLMYDLVCAAASEFDYIIIDCPPVGRVTKDSFIDPFLLPVSDSIVLVVDSNLPTITNTLEAFSVFTSPLRKESYPRERTYIVINKDDKASKITSEGVRDQVAAYSGDGAEWNIAGVVPHSEELWSHANKGVKHNIAAIPEIDAAVSEVMAEVLGIEPEEFNVNYDRIVKKGSSGLFGKIFGGKK